eukprot:TRINITY_DN2157_c0_g1_i1.p1 TRINITY_DN2157_c0_g1~~TRINITY_DN2157_c0_g1_i1.p1  ORF type:complete len:434 (+),score=2.66 TRINITY_DN2157_c0_g1_i1:150-1451(+)
MNRALARRFLLRSMRREGSFSEGVPPHTETDEQRSARRKEEKKNWEVQLRKNAKHDRTQEDWSRGRSLSPRIDDVCPIPKVDRPFTEDERERARKRREWFAERETRQKARETAAVSTSAPATRPSEQLALVDAPAASKRATKCTPARGDVGSADGGESPYSEENAHERQARGRNHETGEHRRRGEANGLLLSLPDPLPHHRRELISPRAEHIEEKTPKKEKKARHSRDRSSRDEKMKERPPSQDRERAKQNSGETGRHRGSRVDGREPISPRHSSRPPRSSNAQRQQENDSEEPPRKRTRPDGERHSAKPRLSRTPERQQLPTTIEKVEVEEVARPEGLGPAPAFDSDGLTAHQRLLLTNKAYQQKVKIQSDHFLCPSWATMPEGGVRFEVRKGGQKFQPSSWTVISTTSLAAGRASSIFLWSIPRHPAYISL